MKIRFLQPTELEASVRYRRAAGYFTSAGLALAAAGLLEIKLAFRGTPQKGFSRGIFHDKMGIFTDSAGNQAAFSGSSNETAGGLVEIFGLYN